LTGELEGDILVVYVGVPGVRVPVAANVIVLDVVHTEDDDPVIEGTTDIVDV